MRTLENRMICRCFLGTNLTSERVLVSLPVGNILQSSDLLCRLGIPKTSDGTTPNDPSDFGKPPSGPPHVGHSTKGLSSYMKTVLACK